MDSQKPEITIEQYAHELEKALIFMCECYKDARDMVAGCRQTDDKQTDDRYFGLYMAFPQIQGIDNLFAMEKIADLRSTLGNRDVEYRAAGEEKKIINAPKNMKINYQFIPMLMICLFVIFFTTPNPMFSFYGINWIMVSLAVLWGIIIIFPLFKKYK